MKLIGDLRQRHLSSWTKALRELKPADIDKITDLPEIEFDEASVKAAVMAGWFSDETDPESVGDLKNPEVSQLAADVWKAFNKARQPDPN